ncbi:MAG: sulfite exporter TauE/SafE family protein [Myxococcales bacterium]|nr:sulfite exporter TauE/SafE family protein [Myxococcales bacterium]
MLVAGQEVSLLALIALGVVVGFVAGLFGIGGGFILTPLLSVVLGIPLPIAIGSGLCQMVGTATVAYLKHQKLGQGEPRFDWLMLGGSLLGVSAGARTVAFLEAQGDVSLLGGRLPMATLVLYAAYIVFLLGSAASLMRRSQGTVETLSYVRRGPFARIALPPYVDLPRVPLTRVSALLIAYFGLALGYLSGLLGLGGGIALMPVLLYGFGFPIKQAAGTGILVLLVTSVSGTLAHAALGHVHLPLSLTLLAGASISAQLGALTTNRLPPSVLRRGLGALILVTTAALLWALVRRIV